ncbi:MAG: hypothetical protein ACRYGL_02205, partial [Janthinobacterium lividum]
VDSGARNIDHILTQAILPELSQQVLERIAMADPFDAVTMTLDAAGAFAFAFDANTHAAAGG